MVIHRADREEKAPVSIRLLGSLQIESSPFTHKNAEASSTIARFQTQKTAALLAFLALHPTHAHSREYLVELLWPDSDLENGRRSLRVALTSLRRQLEPPGIPANMVLIADRNTVRLNFPQGVRIDVSDFEDLIRGIRLKNAPEIDQDRVDAALALYTGPLLPGFYDDWAIRERERLEELYENLQQRRISLTEKETIAARSERSSRQRKSGVKDADTDTRGVLTKSAPSESFPQAAETKNISARLPRRTVRLPITLARFFGRGPERDQINYAFHFSDSRLVTITGPGGAGKTRLSIEFARSYAEATTEASVYFVPLANQILATQIWVTLADSLGVKSTGDTKTLRSRVVDALNGETDANRPCLVILDNFESLVDVGVPLILSLLEDVPTLRILVTSRRRLAIPGEQEVPLGPLPVPSLPGTPERLLEWPSVQLFVDRAQLARSDFQLTARNSEAITHLCSRLEGIPLALELMAAWAGVLSPTQLLQRIESKLLDDPGPPLANQRSRRDSRHQTLRAAIDGSFSLLAAEIKEAFLRLCVFRGGWSLEAAEVLLRDLSSPATDLLSRLRERSMILSETGNDGESVRFRMLETLREFAFQQLDLTQREQLFQQSAIYFLEYAVRIYSPENKNQADTISLIDTEYANLAGAIYWFASQEPQPTANTIAGLRLVYSLGWYWLLRGFTQSGCDHFRTFLNEPLPQWETVLEKKEYLSARAAALVSGAALAMRCDSNTEAQRWSEEALCLTAEGYGTILERIIAFNSLGMVAMARGEYNDARNHCEQALRLYETAKPAKSLASILSNLGLICWYQGDFTEAERYFNACLTDDHQREDQESQARNLTNLGLIACIRGDLIRSQELLEKSLAMRREIKDQHGIVNVLGNLGEVFFQQKKISEAKQVLTESLRLARSLKDSQQVAFALGILGTITADQKEFAAAADYLEESIALFVRLEDRYHIQNALDAYASLAHDSAVTHQKKNTPLSEKAKLAHERAARFWAAADKLRAEINVPLLEKDQQQRNEKISITRNALSEKVFEHQQKIGTALSLNDLVSETQKKI